MHRNYSKWFVVRYTLLGFAIGISILVVTLFVQAFSYKVAFTLSGISEVHRKFPIFFVIDILPILLAVLAYYGAKVVSIAQFESSEFLEKEQSHQRKLYRFVEKLRNGEIDTDYNPDETDVLGKAIVNLRDTLKKSKEEEELRRKEDEQRRWMAEGLAMFGEILRSEKDNIEELTYLIISNLVKYVNANQGGFYLLDDNDPGNW